MSKKTLGIIIATFALFIFAGAGCLSTGTTDVADTENPIVIGGLAPLTGDAAAYGVPVQRSATVAINEINEAGGVLGRELQIKWEDGQCGGTHASSGTQKLVNVDKVSLILGGFCSSETLAAAPIVEREQVILFSPGSSSPDVTDAGDFVFRNWPSDASQGRLLAEHALSEGYAKVGLLSEQQDYTLGISNVFKEVFEAGDGVVAEQTFTSEDTDFKTQLTKLTAEEVDFIFVNAQTPAKFDLAAKQLQELDIQLPLFFNDVGGGATDTIANYANYLEGTVTAGVVIDDSRAFQAFSDAYMELSGGEELVYPDYSSSAYDAVYILKEAIEAAGGTDDAEALRDYLYGIEGREGLAGVLTMDENGDPTSGHTLRVIRGGEVSEL